MLAKLATLLLSATVIVLADAARADPNVEYGESYEAAYLASCRADRPAAACQCSMEVIEETLSFADFAALVEQFGGDIAGAVPAERVDAVLERRCGIAGLAVPRQTDVTQRARSPE